MISSKMAWVFLIITSLTILLAWGGASVQVINAYSAAMICICLIAISEQRESKDDEG